MGPRSVAGIVTVSVAIAVSLFLGTIGWFMIGFGTLTNCTNAYSCTETGCPPCAGADRWLSGGALVQLLLVGTGVAALVVELRRRRGARLVGWGVALLLVAVVAVVGTTIAARESYCRPGTAGYADSYCSVGSSRPAPAETPFRPSMP